MVGRLAGEIVLSDEERAAYSARNTELVNALIDSYQVLYDGLEALRGTATTDGALYTYGEEGKAFFATELKYNACADITPEEALVNATPTPHMTQQADITPTPEPGATAAP